MPQREAESLNVSLGVLFGELRQRQFERVGATLVGAVATLGDVILDDRRAPRFAVRAAKLDLPVAWAVAVPFDRLNRVAAAFAAVEQRVDALLKLGLNLVDCRPLLRERDGCAIEVADLNLTAGRQADGSDLAIGLLGISHWPKSCRSLLRCSES